MNNWDPKIIAAIITASIALIIGIINIYLTIRRDKFAKRQVKNQLSLQKEFEIFKSNLEMESKKAIKKEENKSLKLNQSKSVTKATLSQIQTLKDSLYILEGALKRKNEKSIYEAGEQLSNDTKSFISHYDSSFMDMDEIEKIMLHDLKHVLHSLYSSIKMQKYSGKLMNETRIDENIDYLNKTINKLKVFQEWFEVVYKNK